MGHIHFATGELFERVRNGRDLNVAKAGEQVLMVGYGSGAGSDAFDIEVTDEIQRFDRSYGTPVQQFLDGGVEIPYAVYAKFRGKIRMGGES